MRPAFPSVRSAWPGVHKDDERGGGGPNKQPRATVSCIDANVLNTHSSPACLACRAPPPKRYGDDEEFLSACIAAFL